MKIAGLDIGTTGCKCTVFSSEGKYIDKSYRDYHVKRQVSGHEIDLRDVRDAVLEAVSEMGHKYHDIAGLGVTSFGETFVLTDEDGEPLDVSMLYTDPRGSEECKYLVEILGERRIAEITGLRPHEMYGISKLMWVKKNKPDLYNAAKHVFQVEDFVIFILTHVAQIDYSLATRTMAFDLNTLDWSDEIMEAAGIDRSLCSNPVPSGTIAGKILPSIAEKTGLNEDTFIVSVSQDQVAAAVGAGAFDIDVAVDGAGTVECMIPIYDRKPNVDIMSQGYYVTVPYIVPGTFVTYAFSYTGGALTQWCTETIAKREIGEAMQRGISVNQLLEERYLSKMETMKLDYDEPSGILVLPHFAGAATPYMDTGSKGVIVGLTTDTSVEEIYHACLEGVCYEMYLNYVKLQETGVNFKKMHATGGGARSAVWMQMKADVLNIPMVALKTKDAGTVGCAMMTGIAIGHFTDLEDAASHMVEEAEVYQPRAVQHEKYMNMFERYKKIYELVRPIM